MLGIETLDNTTRAIYGPLRLKICGHTYMNTDAQIMLEDLLLRGRVMFLSKQGLNYRRLQNG